MAETGAGSDGHFQVILTKMSGEIRDIRGRRGKMVARQFLGFQMHLLETTYLNENDNKVKKLKLPFTFHFQDAIIL